METATPAAKAAADAALAGNKDPPGTPDRRPIAHRTSTMNLALHRRTLPALLPIAALLLAATTLFFASAAHAQSTAPAQVEKPQQTKPVEKPAEKPAEKPTAKPAEKPSTEAPKQPPVYAVFDCESGTFRVELALKETPRLCANFINLVNRGYYDGLPWTDFSRVVRQTGINPQGDPAYSLPREFSKNLFFDQPGRLCFSNNSDDIAKAHAKPTRIFITVRPQDRWNLQYAAFGTIADGFDIAANLRENEKIIRVRIEGDVTAHQARYAKQIAQWNAELDKVGLVSRR
jgi:cyclophilin family peptidyl-prolyl cis-trans isomerase